jgi:Tfp pilus assembly protein FimT
MKKIQTTKGITMIEVLISIGVLAIILVVALPILSDFKKSQTLRDATNDTVALLNEARAKTLAGVDSDYYNVFFEEDKATLYKGGTYTEGEVGNKEVIFDASVILPADNIDLISGSEVTTFDKLSGDTDDYGTITLELANDATKTKVITILRTGLVSSN